MRSFFPPFSSFIVMGCVMAVFAALNHSSEKREFEKYEIDQAGSTSVENATSLGAQTSAGISLDELMRTPLFDPTRRRAVEETAIIAEEEQEDVEIEIIDQPPSSLFPLIEYIGYSVIENGFKALVVTAAQEQVWVKIGDELESWRVISISEDRLSLKLGENLESLERFR